MLTSKWIALFLLAMPAVLCRAETNALPRQASQSRIKITTAANTSISSTYRVNGKKATKAEYKEAKALFDEVLNVESMATTNSQSSASTSFTWKAGEKPKQEYTVNGKKATRSEFLAAGKLAPQAKSAPPEK